LPLAYISGRRSRTPVCGNAKRPGGSFSATADFVPTRAGCWALMALLFVGGVMNVLWIAAIAILVLAEKVIPAGRVISRTAGAGLFAGGAWLLAQALR